MSRGGSSTLQPPALQKREGDLVHNSRRNGIMIGAVHLAGITRLLRDECYPRYEYELAVHGFFDEDEAPITQAVGQEITALVRLMWTYALDWSHIPGAAPSPHPSVPTIMKPADARLLRKMQTTLGAARGKTHAFTREFFRQLRAQRMIPVQSQAPVGSEAYRIGTMVDVVAAPSSHVARSRNHNGYTLKPGAKVVLLEIKCGFQRTYNRHTGRPMRFPPSTSDAPHAQHQLQLGVTHALFEYTYATPVSDAYVLRLYEGGAKWYPHRAMDPLVLRALLLRLWRRATTAVANERART